MFDTSHLHPMLVHFPIALAIVGLLFEFVYMFFVKDKSKISNCGEFILYLATISAVATLLSGVLFTSELSGKANEVKELHELLAMLATASLFITSIIYLLQRLANKNGKGIKIAGLTFYIISVLLIGSTGFLGGNLVYSYMIGL